MIPKSCRLFGQDHAQSQSLESAIGSARNDGENEGCAGIGADASRFVPLAAQAAECQTSAPAEHATIRQTTPPPQTAPRNRMSVLSTGNRIVDES
jgi:hypothetical protein